MQINNTAFCALRWPIYPCVLSLFIFLFICRFISHLHKKTFWDKVCLKNFSQASVIKFIHAMLYPQGGTPYFKWRGWPNGDKNPKKSLGLPTPKKCLYQKSTPKKTHAEFPNLKKFQKALNDMAWKIKTLEIECLWTFLYSSYYLKLSWIFILFWRPKSLLKSSHPKNGCQIFLPKNISGLKFQTPKILLSSLTHENPEYPPWGFIYVWYYPHGILLNTIIVRLSHQARSV